MHLNIRPFPLVLLNIICLPFLLRFNIILSQSCFNHFSYINNGSNDYVYVKVVDQAP